jgi:hypothetical protein
VFPVLFLEPRGNLGRHRRVRRRGLLEPAPLFVLPRLLDNAFAEMADTRRVDLA